VLPPYSKQLVWRQNAGGESLTNDTGNTIVVKQFTAYYGGDTPSDFFFQDQSGGAMIAITAPGAAIGPVFTWIHFELLHLVWPIGVTWRSTVEGGGWDWSIHGYELAG